MPSEADKHYRKDKQFDGHGRELEIDRPRFNPIANERSFLAGAQQDQAFVAEDECRGLSGLAAREYVRARRMNLDPSAARAEAQRHIARPADVQRLELPRPAQSQPEAPEPTPPDACTGCGQLLAYGPPAYEDQPRGIRYCRACNDAANQDMYDEDAADADRAEELRRAHPEEEDRPSLDALDFLD